MKIVMMMLFCDSNNIKSCEKPLQLQEMQEHSKERKKMTFNREKEAQKIPKNRINNFCNRNLTCWHKYDCKWYSTMERQHLVQILLW